ncbi:hypothetical protein [Methylocystis echinoides]|uniref:hypothetical protein n=1 Tax=Methylocystis echinoides TaxID=29468 RepID=UPI00341B24C2
MQNHLDALASCSRELTDFQARAKKLQAHSDMLIAGSKIAITDTKQLMRRILLEAPNAANDEGYSVDIPARPAAPAFPVAEDNTDGY